MSKLRFIFVQTPQSAQWAIPHDRHAITGMAHFTRGASDKQTRKILIREKHHRWWIERSQVEAYALGSALDVNRGGWLHIGTLSRSLDLLVLGRGATVTTLIWEDRARSDPCQELIRGIGPNFVVALLMDGPIFAADGRHAIGRCWRTIRNPQY